MLLSEISLNNVLVGFSTVWCFLLLTLLEEIRHLLLLPFDHFLQLREHGPVLFDIPLLRRHGQIMHVCLTLVQFAFHLLHLISNEFKPVHQVSLHFYHLFFE